MRFSIQPEQRPEQRMRTVSIEEVVTACENTQRTRPPLEHYFSPTKKESFVKKFMHYLNTGLLDAKHGEMVGEKEALKAFENELEGHFGDSREVKESVQKSVKKDAINSILDWQREQSIPKINSVLQDQYPGNHLQGRGS